MFKLVRSNIRKDKAVLAVFLLIITLSAMLLQTGLFVNHYDALYDEKKEEYGIGDIVIFAYGDPDTVRTTMDSLSDVAWYTLSDILRPDDIQVSCEAKGFDEVRDDAILHPVSGAHGESCSFVSRDDSVTGPKLYLTAHYAYGNQLEIGDKIRLSTEVTGTKEYTVAGIVEDLQQGNQYGMVSFLMMKHFRSFGSRQAPRRQRPPSGAPRRSSVPIGTG